MFIALRVTSYVALRRSAICLLGRSYKHCAPTELEALLQCPSLFPKRRPQT